MNHQPKWQACIARCHALSRAVEFVNDTEMPAEFVSRPRVSDENHQWRTLCADNGIIDHVSRSKFRERKFPIQTEYTLNHGGRHSHMRFLRSRLFPRRTGSESPSRERQKMRLSPIPFSFFYWRINRRPDNSIKLDGVSLPKLIRIFLLKL